MPPSSPPTSYLRRFVGVSLPLYALDQATKWAVYHTIERDVGEVAVIPGWFYLVHWYNTGAAFSIFSESNWFFTALSAIALIVLAVLARRNLFPDGVSRMGWALLLSGILGNLTDRLVHNAVLDFLLVDLHIRFANPWPAFNVADACICTAAALFLWQAYREGKSPPTAERSE